MRNCILVGGGVPKKSFKIATDFYYEDWINLGRKKTKVPFFKVGILFRKKLNIHPCVNYKRNVHKSPHN